MNYQQNLQQNQNSGWQGQGGQWNNQWNQSGQQQQLNLNRSGHELFDVHEILSEMIGILDQYMIFRGFVKDQELIGILDRQYNFILSQYNITAECFATGSKPSQDTGTYMMQLPTNINYGLNSSSSQSKKPSMSLAEIKDENISCYMNGLIKSAASLLTITATEITNPVVRRVVASQIQNYVEMSYEIFLYQNKHAYYQVPQLRQNDMQQLLHSYVPAPGTPQMPAPKSFANWYQ